MIQTQRRPSLNIEMTAAQNVKKQLLRKASTMPQRMMDEFLARQVIYEKLNNPILRMEVERIKGPPIQPSKLRDAVHEARRKYKEMKKSKNEPMKSPKEVITKVEVQEPSLRAKSVLLSISIILIGIILFF